MSNVFNCLVLDDVCRILEHRFVDDLLVMICFGVKTVGIYSVREYFGFAGVHLLLRTVRNNVCV